MVFFFVFIVCFGGFVFSTEKREATAEAATVSPKAPQGVGETQGKREENSGSRNKRCCFFRAFFLIHCFFLFFFSVFLACGARAETASTAPRGQKEKFATADSISKQQYITNEW